METILLGYTSGNSDKQYRVTIEQASNGTFNTFAHYGRRGTLVNVNLLESNVSLSKAIAAAEKMIKLKLRGGYSEKSRSSGWSNLWSAFQQSAPPPAAPKPSKPRKLSIGEKALVRLEGDWF